MKSRDTLLAEANAILSKSTFSREDSSRVEHLLKLADAVEKPEERDARMRARVAEVDAELAANGIFTKATAAERPEYRKVFRSYLAGGKDAVIEYRSDQGIVSDALGGALCPAPFVQTLTLAMRTYDQLFDVATRIETTNGQAFGLPVADDNVAAAIVTENNESEDENTEVQFSSLAFNSCPLYRSGILRASFEIVEDSVFGFEDMLARVLGRRFSRALGGALVTKLLSDAPTGYLAAQDTSIDADELLELMSFVDPAYGAQGSWAMNFRTLITLRKLRASGSNEFLLPFGTDAGGRTTLFDRPVVITPSMPDIGDGTKPIAFGDLSRLVLRTVGNSMRVRSYPERHAEFGQGTYEAIWRADVGVLRSQITSGTTDYPVAVLEMSPTS